jgi:hypothetical protein
MFKSMCQLSGACYATLIDFGFPPAGASHNCPSPFRCSFPIGNIFPSTKYNFRTIVYRHTNSLNAFHGSRPVQARVDRRQGLPRWAHAPDVRTISRPPARGGGTSAPPELMYPRVCAAGGLEPVRRKAKEWFFANRDLTDEVEIKRAIARGR